MSPPARCCPFRRSRVSGSRTCVPARWHLGRGPGSSRPDRTTDSDACPGGCTERSTSGPELLQEHLRVDEGEQELALAVRQVRTIEQTLDPLAAHVAIDGALVEQGSAHPRIVAVEQREDRRVESHLPPTVDDDVGRDATERVAQHRLRVAVPDEMSRRDAERELEER